MYGVGDLPAGATVDESTPLESDRRSADDYSHAKLRQEELVRAAAAAQEFDLVIVRPGVVYGPGGGGLSRRIGIRQGGVMVVMGGKNLLPLVHVDNCAEAMVLVGSQTHGPGQVVNVHDDDLISAREFLARYRRHGEPLTAVPLPKPVTRCPGTSRPVVSPAVEGPDAGRHHPPHVPDGLGREPVRQHQAEVVRLAPDGADRRRPATILRARSPPGFEPTLDDRPGRGLRHGVGAAVSGSVLPAIHQRLVGVSRCGWSTATRRPAGGGGSTRSRLGRVRTESAVDRRRAGTDSPAGARQAEGLRSGGSPAGDGPAAQLPDAGKGCVGGPRVALWGHGHNFNPREASGPAEKVKAAVTKWADWAFAYTERSAEVFLSIGFDPTHLTIVQNSADVDWGA